MSKLLRSGRTTRFRDDRLVAAVWTRGVELELFLEPLEAVVMQCMWAEHPRKLSAFDVQRLVREEGYTRRYTTIASTLYRLKTKGLVTRVGKAKAFRGRGAYHLYQACNSRRAFVIYLIQEVLEAFSTNFCSELNEVLEGRQ